MTVFFYTQNDKKKLIMQSDILTFNSYRLDVSDDFIDYTLKWESMDSYHL